MKQALFTVTSNTELAPSVLRMTLAGDTFAAVTASLRDFNSTPSSFTRSVTVTSMALIAIGFSFD